MPKSTTIIDGMADQLWNEAFRRYQQRRYPARLGRSAVPPTPPAALEASHDLQRLYLAINKSKGATLQQIMQNLGNEAPVSDARFGMILAANATEAKGYMPLAGGLRIPGFSVEFDGSELTWEGGVSVHGGAPRTTNDVKRRPRLAANGQADGPWVVMLPSGQHYVGSSGTRGTRDIGNAKVFASYEAARRRADDEDGRVVALNPGGRRDIEEGIDEYEHDVAGLDRVGKGRNRPETPAEKAAHVRMRGDYGYGPGYIGGKGR